MQVKVNNKKQLKQYHLLWQPTIEVSELVQSVFVSYEKPLHGKAKRIAQAIYYSLLFWHKLKHLGRAIHAKVGEYVTEWGNEGSISLYDALHGTTLLTEYKAKRKRERYQQMRKSYGL